MMEYIDLFWGWGEYFGDMRIFGYK